MRYVTKKQPRAAFGGALLRRTRRTGARPLGGTTHPAPMLRKRRGGRAAESLAVETSPSQLRTGSAWVGASLRRGGRHGLVHRPIPRLGPRPSPPPPCRLRVTSRF